MPLTTSSFFSINLEFAASTASNAQLSLKDTAIAAKIYPGAGGNIVGPISFDSIRSVIDTQVYSGAGNFGWLGGGGLAGAQLSSVHRINFNNDTVAAGYRGPLHAARYRAAAVSNQSYGWFGGGAASNLTRSDISRIDFANDSPAAGSPRGLLTSSRTGLSSSGNDNYGWFVGGATPTVVSTVDRINYANDSPTSALARNTLSTVRISPAATGNGAYGWFAGGSLAALSTPQSFVERIGYSNDTGALSPRAFLPYGRSAMSATSNSNYGWFAGGYAAALANKWSTVQRIDFSNDSPTTASPRGPLSSARYGMGGVGNVNYGWFMGGGLLPTTSSTVDRVDYSNDTVMTSVRGPSGVAIGYRGATSNYVKSEKGFLLAAKIPLTEVWSINTYTTQATWVEIPGTYGWFAGGWTPGASAVVDRIDFANDSPTAASPRGALSQARVQIGSGNNSNYAWFFGGYSPPAQSTVDRIDFANDGITALARGSLPAVQSQNPAGMPNGNTHVWLTLGNSGTSVGRIEFANDTAAVSVRGNVITGVVGRQGLSNQFYGWMAGGKVVSSVERLDFANDSPTSTSPRGPLATTSRADGAASGNRDYGWIIGGFPGNVPFVPVSSVERIDYANDSPTSASPRSNIPVAVRSVKSSGNANYGWAAGGANDPNPLRSTVYRIDYSNDTAATPARGLLTVAREIGASSSNFVIGRSQPAGTTTSTAYFPATIQPTFGVADSGAGTFVWFVGGYQGGGKTNIDRINVSNDLVAASPRGQLVSGKNANAGASNANFGWISGGGSPNVDVARIDFASDLTTPSPRAAMTTGRQDLAATGNANYGWFGGGFTPGPTIYSLVVRIDYASDLTTPSVRGPLLVGRSSLSAVGNANYGWWIAGSASGGDVNTIERIDFASESPTAAINRGSLPTVNRDNAAHGTANYGWVSGGSPSVSNVWRIDYSNDTAAAGSRANLSRIRSNFKGAGNASFGWVGPTGSGDSTIDRIDYTNDTNVASPRGNLSLARFSMAAVSNFVKGASASPGGATPIIYTTATTTRIVVNGNYGWWTGGQIAVSVSTVDRIDFSNDSPTAASSRGSLRLVRSSSGAVSNANYGWIGGGITPGTASSVDRIDFANDSGLSVIRSNLSSPRSYISATGNNNYGWFGGGYAPTNRLDYSNDSLTASARGNLSTTRIQVSATGNANYGWFGGGYGSGSVYSIIDRIDFANDNPTSASPRGRLTSARYSIAATGNANYGWWGGGTSDTFNSVSNVDRVDFANDSPTSASPRSPLSLARTLSNGATGNADYGWFAGGQPGSGAVSTVDRIDFSNDTAAVSIRGPLSLARYSGATVSNTAKDNLTFSAITGNVGTYGWFGGGMTSPASADRISTVSRIDFSNDSPTAASSRGLLSMGRRGLAGTGNANYGWFGGGANTISTTVSTVDRIDFSNDSPATSSPRGPLSVATEGLSATGNANYGWVGGGTTPVIISTVNRIDFSNDSPTAASIRGFLGLPVYGNAAVSTSNYSWWGGGYAPGAVSTVLRIDFSNDSPTSSITRGPLSLTRTQLAATSNPNYGWFAGGQPGPYSRVDRIDFANDSPTAATTRGSLSQTLYSYAAAGNANYGWFGGGFVSGIVSIVNRIDYSNDLVAASIRGPISSRSTMAAVSNYVQSRTEILASSPVNWPGGTWIRGGLSIV